jgi:hypothetical protein
LTANATVEVLTQYQAAPTCQFCAYGNCQRIPVGPFTSTINVDHIVRHSQYGLGA